MAQVEGRGGRRVELRDPLGGEARNSGGDLLGGESCQRLPDIEAYGEGLAL